MSAFCDLTHFKKGYLEVIKLLTKEELKTYDIKKLQPSRYWLTYCNNCGSTKVYPSHYLRWNKIISCGCIGRKVQQKFIESRRKSYGEAAKNSFYKQMISWAKRRNIAFTLSKDELLFMVSQPCFYCGQIAKSEFGKNRYYGSFIHNGVDRINSDLPYNSNNCVPCCKVCNLAKGSQTIDEFRIWIKKVTAHWAFKP